MVPELLHLDRECRYAPLPSAVFEFVSGPTMDIFLQSAEATARHAVLDKLAMSLAQLHALPRDVYGTLSATTHQNGNLQGFWTGLVTKEHSRLERVAPDWIHLFDSLVGRWTSLIENLPTELSRSCLVHGDVHGKNVIVREQTELFIIDWEACRSRFAAYDFAQLNYCNFRSAPDDWRRLLQSYAEVRALERHLPELIEAIAMCEVFWRLRMGLFFLQYPEGESEYFGSARSHIAAVEAACRRQPI
jgi:Ser/Thr protein kinase RdoA (MazF antagonist)